jgi:hypothetical protein
MSCIDAIRRKDTQSKLEHVKAVAKNTKLDNMNYARATAFVAMSVGRNGSLSKRLQVKTTLTGAVDTVSTMDLLGDLQDGQF